MKLHIARPSLGRARTATGSVRARPRDRARGQSLTELSLILPVLLLLTVAALDFGRVYLGYVNLQNMARIAANYAANNPLAWGSTPDASIQERYANQVIEDAAATNCQLPVAGGEPVIPAPAFTDVTGDGVGTGLGDRVSVALTCDFQVITPIIGAILGDTIQVTAESDFPIKAGMTAVAPAGSGSGGGGSGTGIAPSAAFEAGGIFSTDADPVLWLTGPDVTVAFRDASGGGTADTWRWRWDDGTADTYSQDATHTFSCTTPDFYGFCSYLVDFRVANTYGHTHAYMAVMVDATSSVDFTVSPASITTNQSVTFTDASTAGGTNYRWDFGDGSAQVSGAATTVNHPYTAAGTYTVKLWVTYPEPLGERPPASKTVTVSPGYCTVPSLNNVRFNDATAIWRGAPYNFTGTVKRAAGAPSGNFKITAQSIASGGGATALCNSDVYVSAP